MTMKRRIATLEAAMTGVKVAPVIFRRLVSPSEAGPVDLGLLLARTPSGTLFRGPQETDECFEDRACAVSKGVLCADEKSDAPLKQAPLSPATSMKQQAPEEQTSKSEAGK